MNTDYRYHQHYSERLYIMNYVKDKYFGNKLCMIANKRAALSNARAGQLITIRARDERRLSAVGTTAPLYSTHRSVGRCSDQRRRPGPPHCFYYKGSHDPRAEVKVYRTGEDNSATLYIYLLFRIFYYVYTFDEEFVVEYFTANIRSFNLTYSRTRVSFN